jgi:hypothetical protein
MAPNNDLHFGSYIPEEMTIAWVQAINDYELNYRPELTARNVLPYRNIGPQFDFDNVVHHQSTSGLADVVAKGATPAPIVMKTATEKNEMFQIMTGFYVTERDLAKSEGVTMKQKELDACMQMIHAREDYTLINGNSDLGIDGMVTKANANTRGKITATNVSASGANLPNMGAWDGSGDTRDPYEDVVNACRMMDYRYKPAFLLADRITISYLNMKDSERIPFAEDMGPLFGKPEGDRSWMIESQFVPTGYAYLAPYNPQAGEFVVSQEIDIKDDYAKQPGGNFYIELSEWINPAELHVGNAFVQINTKAS